MSDDYVLTEREQLQEEMENGLYLSFASGKSFQQSTQDIIEQIRLQKSELFFIKPCTYLLCRPSIFAYSSNCSAYTDMAINENTKVNILIMDHLSFGSRV